MTQPVNERVSKLVVDLFDTANHHLLFRGVADQDLGDNSGQNIGNLFKNIDKMFHDFPPKAKHQG